MDQKKRTKEKSSQNQPYLPASRNFSHKAYRPTAKNYALARAGTVIIGLPAHPIAITKAKLYILKRQFHLISRIAYSSLQSGHCRTLNRKRA